MNVATLPAAAPGAAADPSRIQRIRHYLVSAVPTAELDDNAGRVRKSLIGRSYDDASHVFVLTGAGALAGVVEIGKLLGAAAGTPLSALVGPPDYPVVTPDADREEAASLAIRAGISALAVCEADGRFIGAVPGSAMMAILREEHLEDIHHMAGILGKSDAALAALAAPPHRRAFYRLPWLLVGMAGSALATAIMAQFEAALTAHIAVAFFIPAIVYLADAVGTQSEAVAVRSLSLDESNLLSLLTGELGTGIVIGTALAAVAFPLVWLAFGDLALAGTVSLALLAASSIASTIGFFLPWLFARLGFDPALGSGPLATVIQDALSLLIYFLVATSLIF